ncbi:MAG: pyridoxamine 5'-phosphate oxidase [Bacteroidales bacterium]|jgi:pyridoxamine 5'-phosphate oxidase|nr:pyridoxamine 5'-phosphate oxidase [Bacteroidales bacterium]
MKPTQKIIVSSRTEYIADGLDEKNLSGNPLDLFEKWMAEAERKIAGTPNATFLATAGPDARPSGRIVLLRGFDERGFEFFTNYESRKGIELRDNNYASMTFFWNELFRQIRIEGEIHKLPEEVSDEYFSSRPRESQIAAIASDQSRLLPGRELLEERVRETEKLFEGKPVVRPPHWGGYCLSPSSIEFWQGRPHRLHDRILYSRKDLNEQWIVERLYP